MPLREVQQSPAQDADGHYHQPPVAYYCQLFSSMDVLNWQTHSMVLRGATRYDWTNGDNFFQTHRPTWDDIIQLLVSLYSPEERHGILTEARKWLG